MISDDTRDSLIEECASVCEQLAASVRKRRPAKIEGMINFEMGQAHAADILAKKLRAMKASQD